MLSEIPERNKTENRYKYEFQIYFLSFRLDKPHLSLMAQCLQCWRLEVNPWVLEDPLEEEMATTPVFLSGESHGQRSLVGYSPWGHKELDTTEQFKLGIHDDAVRHFSSFCVTSESHFIAVLLPPTPEGFRDILIT